MSGDTRRETAIHATTHRSLGRRYRRAVFGHGDARANVHDSECGVERNGSCGGGCRCWCHKHTPSVNAHVLQETA